MVSLRSCSSILAMIVITILLYFYGYPSPPKVSIEEFSVPAFNKSSDQIAGGNIYFDLKLYNTNSAVGIYYDDPFSLGFFFFPYEDPSQKYVWVGTLPAFYQGNGKTKHIRSLVGSNLQLPSSSMVVVENKHVRTLLRDHLQLPSSLAGENQDANQVLAETRHEGMVGRTLVVNVRIAVIINYRFKYWFGASKHQLELGANVLIDNYTGERVTTGSIDLVESAAPAKGRLMLMVFFTSFLFIISF